MTMFQNNRALRYLLSLALLSTLTSCDNIEDALNCGDICDELIRCYDSALSRRKCVDRCYDAVEEDGELSKDADKCASCIEDLSCKEASDECSTCEVVYESFAPDSVGASSDDSAEADASTAGDAG